jgi:hypothetical protein
MDWRQGCHVGEAGLMVAAESLTGGLADAVIGSTRCRGGSHS